MSLLAFEKNKKEAWKKRLVNASTRVFHELGPHHAEVVYQRALIEELQASNAWSLSISSEVPLPIFYTPSASSTPIAVGMCRLDIVITCNNESRIVLELKGSSSQVKKTANQVHKYKRLLEESATIFVVTFGPTLASVELID